MGGLASILTVLGILTYMFWKSQLYFSRARDEFYQGLYFREFNEIGKIPLNDPDFNAFSFEVYVNDPDFDNEDNPWASIVLHKYTNMKNENPTEQKEFEWTGDHLII